MNQKSTLVFILFFSFCSFAFGDENDQNAKNTTLPAIANDIATQFHDMGWFSGSVLVIQDDKEIFVSSYGFQNIKEQIKNTGQTRFNLGSIMKDFTKVLVLQQIEKGKLRLNSQLISFDLGFKQSFTEDITIEQLLNHSAGFDDIFVAEYRENPLAFDTLDKKLSILIDRPLIFKPGTDNQYSNYGYIVLGKILEKVTGEPFEELLKNKIFLPTEMTDTTFEPSHSHDHQSVKYTYQYDSTLREVGVVEHPSPDGGIESTVRDVHRFYKALFYTNKLLQNSNPINRKVFAMDKPHWGAYGGGLGVSAAVEIDLASNYQIVVLANSDNLVAELISGRILSFIKNGEYAPVRQLEKNFAYEYYKTNGKKKFSKQFKLAYSDEGYERFIGRTINELGMELLRAESFTEAFDMFYYLVSLFPDAPQVYDSLAFAYLSKGDETTAKDTFSQSLAIKADFESDYVSDNYGHDDTVVD
ncbi:serine hydrolase domain-containing protein [Alteromonas sp. CI.11.F.A3]|uniref:serine hydrolase domain-containing protein n=1 Tax=Alteromonas sp. CI.11.F.A3 TaxID=3079555 RepID=UPI002941FE50|nr:serine hydrolase domain-containing protein [Alteromonas sp. CI.11.F.A3]WOI38609.1 serine hydrolase domain-containing protein [Alteromonas sp. CI.11.F.A3]